MNQEPTRYPYIDALRGLAILGVLVVHAAGTCYLPPNPLSYFIDNGARGVQLFFIVSALTLTMSMRFRSEPSWTNFFIRRLFRILPAYYAAILFFFLWGLSGEVNWLSPTNPLNMLATALFAHIPFGDWQTSLVPGGWTVATEMHFYIVLPLLLFLITNWQRAVLAFFISLPFATISSSWLTAHVTPHPSYTFFWLPAQLPVFLLGIALYYLLPHLKTMVGETAKSASVILLIAGVALLWYTSRPNLAFQNHVAWGLMLTAFIAAVSIYQWPLLVNKPLAFLGRISFSVYLIHWFLLTRTDAILSFVRVAMRITISPAVEYALFMIILLALSCAVGHIIYTYIELPGISIGKRIIIWRENSKAKLSSPVVSKLTEEYK